MRQENFWTQGQLRGTARTSCQDGCSSAWPDVAFLCRDPPVISRRTAWWRGWWHWPVLRDANTSPSLLLLRFFPKLINLVLVCLIYLFIHSTGAICEEDPEDIGVNKINGYIHLQIVIRALKKCKQASRIEQVSGQFSRRQTGKA